MKTATVFINLVISFFLLTLIFSISTPIIFRINQKLLANSQQQNYENQVMVALNKIYFEIKTCQKIINTKDYPTNQKIFSCLNADGQQLSFTIKNKRLIRKTEGIVYLTGKDLEITNFKIKHTLNLVEISFVAMIQKKQKEFQRKIFLINV